MNKTTYANKTTGNKYCVRDLVSALCRIYGTRRESELFACIQYTVLEISGLAESRDKKGVMLAMAFCNMDRYTMYTYLYHIVGDGEKADDMADALWCLGYILSRTHKILWRDICDNVQNMRDGIIPMNWIPDIMKVGVIIMETILSVSMYLSM